jgi:alginate O-acetyltransferase complex protein AlgI
MFKKVVIADSLAPMVDDIFGNYQDFGGGTLWLGAIYFAHFKSIVILVDTLI